MCLVHREFCAVLAGRLAGCWFSMADVRRFKLDVRHASCLQSLRSEMVEGCVFPSKTDDTPKRPIGRQV